MARAPKLKDMVTIAGTRGGTRQVTRQEAVLELVRQGVTHKQAALQAGISESTFYLWRKKGREARSGQYREFVDALEVAEAKAEAGLTLQMRVHATKDWRAAAFMLERRFPDRWKKREQVDNTHQGVVGGAPVGVQLQLADMTPAQLAGLGQCDLDAMDDLSLPTDPDPAQEPPE